MPSSDYCKHLLAPNKLLVLGDGLCLKTEEPEEVDEDAEEVSLVLPDDFYPALKWTLKNGWKPLVDAADDLKGEELEEVKRNRRFFLYF